jgi:Tol biopolymer transport system component
VRCSLSFLLLTLFSVIIPSAGSQEFGRNNVRYEQFDFRVYRSLTFELLSYPPVDEAAVDSARMLERWNSRYRRLFDHTLSQRQPIILYANHTDFSQTNAIPGLIPQGVQGVTEGRGGRIVLPLSPSYLQNDHVLGHELVHAFHFDMLRGRSRAPLWLLEGMAEYASLGPSDNETAVWIRDALRRESLPTIQELSRRPGYSPYRWGHALWAYIAGRYGDEVISEFYPMAANRGLGRALEEVLGTDVVTLTREWHSFLREEFGDQLQSAASPAMLGEPLSPGGESTGISPVLSPDGRYVAFFGSRRPLSFDLIVAETDTGEVLGTLSARSRSAHFDALRFMYGAGAFSPEGERLAFVIERRGRQGIAIAEVPSLEIEETLFFDEIEAISHVAWRRDGRELALSGGNGGIWNLYTVTLRDRELSQRTRDRYAQVQPAYSPDGSRLVYATDRTEKASFDSLFFEGTALEIYDLDTGERSRLDLPENALYVSPHVTGEESHIIYFVSDLDVVPNIYRYHRETGTLTRITNVSTGVIGLSRWSPALSVADDGDQAAVTVFDEGETKMRRLSLEELAASREVALSQEGEAPAGRGRRPSLGPRDRSSIVSTYLQRPEEGLAAPDTVRPSPYTPGLTVSEVQRFFIGIGATPYGTTFYGGISLSFADLLGNNRLGGAVQVYGDFENAGAAVSYRNRKRRVGWGIDASHLPDEERLSATERETVELDGESRTAEVTTTVRSRRVYDEVDLVGEYPFNRNLRLEGKLGFTYIRIEEIVEEVARESDGDLIVRREERRRPVDPLSLGRTPVALVGDYSVWGYTGPLRGSRFRFEAEPTFGSVSFLSLVGDLRYYLYFRPFSLALRGYHEGRYMPSGREEFLSPLNLGFPTFVRGYEPWTFTDSDTPTYRSTRGNRLLAANAELRAPLFGPGGVGLFDAQPFPLTLVAFFDAGAAWFDEEVPMWKITGDPCGRVPLFSTGFAGRLNFGNILFLEIYWARPFQRPSRESIAGFQFRTGF